MIDLYFYFLKQNRVSIQVTIESGANVQYTIDCIKLGDDGFKSNSYMRINAKFLEDGLKEILDTFGMLEDFESRYLKMWLIDVRVLIKVMELQFKWHNLMKVNSIILVDLNCASHI